MSLLDVTIAATVLAVSITSLMTLIVHSIRLSRVNRETAIAAEAAQQMTEMIQSVGYENIFAAFSANPNFAVPGLDAQAGDVDGMVGTIEFPTVGGQLREDVNDAGMGMPRDLDGDGAIDGSNHANDYILLPVRMRLDWRGVSGDRTMEVTTLLLDW